MDLPVSQNSGVFLHRENISFLRTTQLPEFYCTEPSTRLDLHTELYKVTEVCSPSVIGGTTYTEPNIDM